MNTNSTLVIFAVMASLGLVTVVAVDIMLTVQQAEAKGCRTSVAVNASKGRCFSPGPAVQSADEATIDDQVEGEENEATIDDQVEGEENEGEEDQDDEEDEK